MKAKVLIFTIIFSLNFANYCEAQIIEGIVSGLLKKSKKTERNYVSGKQTRRQGCRFRHFEDIGGYQKGL